MPPDDPGPTGAQTAVGQDAKRVGTKVPVLNATGQQVASLKPIIAPMAPDPDLLADLCR